MISALDFVFAVSSVAEVEGEFAAPGSILFNLFAILVLVAHLAGKANATTALGAALFFWGRVGHAAAYIAGIIYLRTAVFFIATIGELLILSQLF